MRRVDGTEEVDEDLSVSLLRRAFELGVNYVDTAWGYVGGRSESVVGKAIKGWRGRVRVSTKYPLWESKSRDDFRVVLEKQLKRLDLDYVDFYHLHGLDLAKWNDVVMPQHLLDEMAKAMDEGLIRFASFSFHDKPEVMRQFVDTGYFSSVLCQYNLLDRANEDAMAYAAAKGLGVAVMGPLGGGRLAVPVDYLHGAVSADRGTPEVALRFVLSNHNVCCALSGMNTMEQVERNAAVATEGRPLSEFEMAEVRNIMDSRKRLGEMYCTGCKYCMPCPSEVNIPVCLESLIHHRVYGFTDFAAMRYNLIGGPWVEGKQADECVDCGQCETKCPQKVSIRRHLREVHAELGSKGTG
jgi:predicted aldo/keto reductase-like oxidoreductase